MNVMKRALSLVLCLVMLVGILPNQAFFASAAETPVDALVVMSDLHINTNQSQTNSKKQLVVNVLNAIKNDIPNVSTVNSAGDMFSSNESNMTGNASTVTDWVDDVFDVPVNYVWSDHDRAATDISKESRLVYSGNYYVYLLSMADVSSWDRYYAGFYSASEIANHIAAFKTTAAGLDKTKPLFIVGHQPLFDDRGDNGYAYEWVTAINEVAANMDVAYFFGHNHKYDDNQKSYYYAKGETMPVPTTKVLSGSGYSTDLEAKDVVLNFTHINAGYMNPETTSNSTQTNARLGTALAVEIFEDSIRYVTYNSNGVYKNSFAVDESVKRDHAKSDEPEGTTSNKVWCTAVINDESEEGYYMEATAPGLTAITADYVYNEYEDLITETFVDGLAFNVALEGHNADDEVAYYFEKDNYIDADGLMLYHVGENNKLTAIPYQLVTEDGDLTYISFTSKLEGVFIYGNLAIPEGYALSHMTVDYRGATRYLVGETLDMVNLTATAVYTKAGAENVEKNLFPVSETVSDGYTFVMPDMTTAGVKTVTLTYGDVSASFEIEVFNKNFFHAATDVSLQISVPGATALDVTAVTEGAAFEAAAAVLAEGFVAYDIDVEGFVNNSSIATVTIPCDAEDPLVYYVSDDGVTMAEMTVTNVADGYVTFETTHFTVFVAGTRDNNTTITGAYKEGEGNLPGTTTYKLDTNGVDDGAKYLIVSAASGNPYAFRNNGGTSARQQVTVGSNSTINGGFTNESACVWTFDSSGNGWYIINDTQRVRLSNRDILNNSGQVLTVTSQGSGAYTIRNGSYYLRYRSNSWQRYDSSGNVYLFKQETTAGTSVNFKLQVPAEMDTEATQDLVYEVTLADGTTVTGCTIAWSTSNNRVVTVNNGRLTSTTAGGTTNITARLTAVNGIALSQAIEVTVPVTAKAPNVTLDVAPESLDMVVNGNEELKATVTYNGSVLENNYVLTWTSSDTKVATVDQNGKVTAVAAGNATITASLTKANGKTVSLTKTVSVSVAEKEAVGISVNPTTITVERDTPVTAEVGTITVDYGEGDTAEVPLTLGMLQGNKDLTVNGVYENLKVSYAGKEATGITLKVIDRAGNNYPEYPDPGSVKVDKTADTTNLQSFGVVNIELSTSGLPVVKGVDVIVMLDLSTSMDRCVAHDTKKHNCDSPTRLEALRTALSTFETELKNSPNADNIKVAIADFNVFHQSGADAYDSNDYIEGEFYVAGTNKVYTGDKSFTAGAFQSAATLSVAGFSMTTGNGTNYDYAFDTIYRLGTAIKAQNKANGQEDRDLIVLFMSDGAANQFNFYRSTGGSGAEDPTYGWNFWLDGTMTADQLKSTAQGGLLQSATHAYYYDSIDHDGDGHLNEHRMANAIKGDPNTKYEVIRKSASVEGGVTLEAGSNTNLYLAPGLGATMYSVAFDIANDGPITDEAAFVALEQIATSDKYYVNAANEDDLKNAFRQFATDITYAATDAYYMDQMGDTFDLQMADWVNARNTAGTLAPKALPENLIPKIQILNYALYTQAEADAVPEGTAGDTVTDAMVGQRKTGTDAKKVVEEVRFASEIQKINGVDTIVVTGAYSNKVDKDGDGIFGWTVQNGNYTYDTADNILGANGVISAANFYYNNSHDTLTVDGYKLEPETFRWNIGIINNVEWVLSYYSYLSGSMEGETSSGSYKTNNYANLYYKNWLGNNAFQATTSPQAGWLSANVSYGFYLVNSQGQPIVNQTTGQTGSITNAVKVTQPVVYDEILLNNLDNVDTIHASSLSVLPAGYKLYDESASYKVVVLSEDGQGSWTITSDSGKTQSTYVYGYAGGQYSNVPKVTSKYIDDKGMTAANGYLLETNYDYTHTTVWFAVVWIPKALPDAVVVDYGLPVDISVLTNDQFGQNGTLNGIGKVENVDKSLLNNENANPYTGTKNPAFTDKVTTTYGDAVTLGNKVRYTPRTMSWNSSADGAVSYDRFVYEVEYKQYDYSEDADGNVVQGALLATQYYYGVVSVIPATSIYYEDDFTSSTGSYISYQTYNGTTREYGTWETEGTTNVGATQAEDRPGKYSISDVDANNAYGQDGNYSEMATWSNNSAKKVHVDANNVAIAKFDFYGTGLDIISMTSNATGTLVLQVRDADGNLVVNQTVDTYYGYDYVNGEWVLDTSEEGNGCIYQVPVLKADIGTYGKYSVTLRASYFEALDHTQAAGYDLYLDAVRIYNPAGIGDDLEDDIIYDDADGYANDMTISDIYVQDGEGWPRYEELRDQLIDEDTYKTAAGSDTYKGAIFIDGKGESVGVSDYTNFGPNNELYLAKGQAVAFELDLSAYIVDKTVNGKTVKQSIVADVQIGVKSVDGSTVKVTLTADNISATREFKTATEMYYSFAQLVDLGVDANDSANNSKTTVLIRNSSDADGVVSITNIKVTFKEQPPVTEQATLLSWGRNTGERAMMMMMRPPVVETEPEEIVPDVTEPEVPETSVPEETEPEQTVPEVTEPDNTELKAAVEAAKKLKEKDYTKESFKTVQDARKAAEKVLKDKKATQEQIDTALEELNEAMESLELKPSKDDKPGKDNKPTKEEKPAKNDKVEQFRNNVKETAKKAVEAIVGLFANLFR